MYVRWSGIGKRVAASLVALAISAGGAAHATQQPKRFTVPDSSTSSSQWLCHYGPGNDGAWYMHCHDLAELLNDDPVLNDGPARGLVKRIPLWSAPFDQQQPHRLATAVLCRAQRQCSVELATRSGI